LSEFLSGLSDAVVAVSAMAVAVIAYRGLKTWNAEMNGRASFELARRAASLVFKIGQTLRAARNPLTSAAESAERSRTEGENQEASNALDEWFARAKRLEPIAEALREFQ
jgi:hypothetical protein